jgi:uncharacterized membrane protein
MTDFSKHIILYSIMYISLYFISFQQNEGLMNIGLFVLWTLAVLLFLTSILADYSKYKHTDQEDKVLKYIKRSLMYMFIVILIYNGYFILGLLYLASVLIILVNKSIIDSKISGDKQ